MGRGGREHVSPSICACGDRARGIAGGARQQSGTCLTTKSSSKIVGMSTGNRLAPGGRPRRFSGAGESSFAVAGGVGSGVEFSMTIRDVAFAAGLRSFFSWLGFGAGWGMDSPVISGGVHTPLLGRGQGGKLNSHFVVRYRSSDGVDFRNTIFASVVQTHLLKVRRRGYYGRISSKMPTRLVHHAVSPSNHLGSYCSDVPWT